MGLDQQVFSKSPSGEETLIAEWRNHADLHQFMENIIGGDEDSFECSFVLTKQQIIDLEKCLVNDSLPVTEWEYIFSAQNPTSNKEYDLKFCEVALSEIDKGKHIVYKAWW